MDLNGLVLDGTCGFTDESMARCRRFYPPGTRTTAEKLTYYSSKFPCVEIDTSTYAIPQQDAVKQWIACVPPGFKFHIKAFGIFTAPDKKTPVQSMPGAVTRTLPPSLQSKSSLSLADLPQDAVEALWERFTAVLRILEDAGKLGMVVFQFSTGFVPCVASVKHLEECRARMGTLPIAVDFRDRRWFGFRSSNGLSAGDVAVVGKFAPPPDGGGDDADTLAATLALARRLNLCLASSDDLKHEFVGRAEPEAGEGHVLLPIHTYVTGGAGYIRIHRRAGAHRLLREGELKEWAARVARMCAARGGPVYVMWATDHEDQPIVNAMALRRLLAPAALMWEWKRAAPTLASFFAKAVKGQKAEAAGPQGTRAEEEEEEEGEGQAAVPAPPPCADPPPVCASEPAVVPVAPHPALSSPTTAPPHPVLPSPAAPAPPVPALPPPVSVDIVDCVSEEEVEVSVASPAPSLALPPCASPRAPAPRVAAPPRVAPTPASKRKAPSSSPAPNPKVRSIADCFRK